jgi:hypothetical protein
VQDPGPGPESGNELTAVFPDNIQNQENHIKINKTIANLTTEDLSFPHLRGI